MRLWSLDPALLDRAALVAGWREGLLAQKVLLGLTKGYRAHPQLARFRELEEPVTGVVTWLAGVAAEADRRGYRFDRSRLAGPPNPALRLPLTQGQLGFEWAHLRAKVAGRDALWWEHLEHAVAAPHPMFEVVPGPVADWERG